MKSRVFITYGQNDNSGFAISTGVTEYEESKLHVTTPTDKDYSKYLEQGAGGGWAVRRV